MFFILNSKNVIKYNLHAIVLGKNCSLNRKVFILAGHNIIRAIKLLDLRVILTRNNNLFLTIIFSCKTFCVYQPEESECTEGGGFWCLEGHTQWRRRKKLLQVGRFSKPLELIQNKSNAYCEHDSGAGGNSFSLSALCFCCAAKFNAAAFVAYASFTSI